MLSEWPLEKPGSRIAAISHFPPGYTNNYFDISIFVFVECTLFQQTEPNMQEHTVALRLRCIIRSIILSLCLPCVFCTVIYGTLKALGDFFLYVGR